MPFPCPMFTRLRTPLHLSFKRNKCFRKGLPPKYNLNDDLGKSIGAFNQRLLIIK
ncbi:hypothetical protein JOC76_003308 [Neobacillus cucumis]|nr:hypothetical protein [Neobacillus cucumis]